MQFYQKVRHLLGEHRAGGFDYIFDFLRGTQNPLIVETGCARQENNYFGDGQSSLLFDGYVQEYGGQGTAENRQIDLLYLDSFDAPKDRPDIIAQSSLHHLYEFITILKSLKAGTLVCVDDCWAENGRLSGKGTIIADYMAKIGIMPCRLGYQTMWKYF